MQVNPHLTFDGRCREAFQFYEECLRARIVTMIAYADSPMAEQVPPDWRDRILHATLGFSRGGHIFTGADALPDQYRKPGGFAVMLNTDDAAEAERIFRDLGEGGEVQMPLQETFWARRFGMLVDRFGTPWIINCGTPA